MLLQPLSKTFYEQEALILAKSLLGKLLAKKTEEGIATGRIVETEAYMGPIDQAAHSYQNRRTKRTEVMFGPPGYTYTYSMHTHCLVNVVCGEEGQPQAVLIRAVEPLSGIELMYQRRDKVKKETDLTSGPGKLTKAMGITMNDYGKPLDSDTIFIAEGETPLSISHGPRIGIANSGEAKDYPWRFWETGNRFVSR
ncbi:3-methyladenine DNA glycosylase [Salipaludibacillus neizhouensis]|uniref:Putative 3-methyladenine DNA glycosylase n=1 Tax=Salipaludibacillus neizhouensis TaxID=885475 RepID=A0A3A9K5I5_9BACI|nr:DNA-3-methyladenine glycosylase [Salipaludibacillus neizhouensis]RKL65631.1 3-methyladenine DNA glycosylase [Salipaludibacillus neizhouensis]